MISNQSENSAGQSLYLRGIIKFCQSLQDQFLSLVKSLPTPQPGVDSGWNRPEDILRLSVYQEIQTTLTHLEFVAQKNGFLASDLSAPSLRAYQWLHFLSIPENLQAHLNALHHILHIRNNINLPKKRLSDPKPLPLRPDFFHIAGLFRAKRQETVQQVVIHEGYIFAPASVLQSLVYLVYHRQVEPSRASIRAYAESPAFIQCARQLASIGKAVNSQARGHYQDLQKVFDRVNARFFDSRMEMPHLAWSNVLTYRKFGHYQPSTDSLMLSASLDDASTPDYVLDFAMYHELLHKHLGYHTRNNRRISHHAAFRQLEAQFHQYKEAQQYLTTMHKKIKNKK